MFDRRFTQLDDRLMIESRYHPDMLREFYDELSKKLIQNENIFLIVNMSDETLLKMKDTIDSEIQKRNL